MLYFTISSHHCESNYECRLGKQIEISCVFNVSIRTHNIFYGI